MSRRSQKTQIRLANEGYGLAIFSTDLGYIVGNKIDNELGVMMSGKGPLKLEFANDVVHIHSLMIYMEFIEYNLVGDTEAPLLRCFFFNSKLKAGEIIFTKQYVNYQTLSNLQFRPLLKNSFHSCHIHLRDTIGEKIPFVSVGITQLVLMSRKTPTFISNLQDVTRWLLQGK